MKSPFSQLKQIFLLFSLLLEIKSERTKWTAKIRKVTWEGWESPVGKSNWWESVKKSSYHWDD